MQGLIKLLEEKVEIRCLKRDLAVIKELAIECEQEFGQTSLVPTYIKINEHHFLDTSSIGGVILTSFSGRIVCDNTLKSRLDYALQLALPVVRKMLFA